MGISTTAARLAIAASVATLLTLGSLHLLSPEFDPAWRMVSEYALGHYGWVLSVMFLLWGVSNWALAAAVWSHVQTRSGRIGLWFLLVAGAGEAMAAVFDINQPAGHGIAGLLGVLGFPVAAMLVTTSLAHRAEWAPAKRPLMWLAHLTWISVVLLIGTLVMMTVQFARANGGTLPQHAPKVLPPGVIGVDGWADRLIVVSSCAWSLCVAAQAIIVRRRAAFRR